MTDWMRLLKKIVGAPEDTRNPFLILFFLFSAFLLFEGAIMIFQLRTIEADASRCNFEALNWTCEQNVGCHPKGQTCKVGLGCYFVLNQTPIGTVTTTEEGP